MLLLNLIRIYSHFKIRDLETVGQVQYMPSNGTTFAVVPFDGKYLTSALLAIVMLALYHRFRDINFSNVCSRQFRSRSQSTYVVIPLGGEYQPLQSIPLVSTLTLTVSEIWEFEMFDLENCGQGRRVEHSQWRQ